MKYWTFKDRPGRWVVMEGCSHKLEQGAAELEIKMWVRGHPVVQGYDGTDVYGTAWIANTAVQRGKEAPDVWQTQEGGSHYTDMKIQPFQYSMANGLDPMQHTIIKYVSRFRSKHGIEDLRKARQTLDLLIAWETEHAVQL